MYSFILVGTILFLGIVWWVAGEICDRKYNFSNFADSRIFGATITVIFSLIFLYMCLHINIGHHKDKRFISEFEAVRSSIESQRLNKLTELERATLTTKILEWNAELAEKQYEVKNPWTNIFYHKSLLTVKPIK